MSSTSAPTAKPRTPLKEVALLFLRLGTTAFGGPAAHIAMMENEVVRRRRWITRERFLDLLGATNLIPGPNSTEMAIHIGHQRAGWAGLVVAGACFIVPASLITLGLAWVYVEFGARPQAGALLYGVKPVIIAIVVQALWGLARTAVKSKPLAVLAVLAVAATVLRVDEIVVLLAAGAIAAASHSIATGGLQQSTDLGVWIGPSGGVTPIATSVTTASTLVVPFGLTPLFFFFLKVGAILFGSGYVLLAFLRADLVDHWRWLTDAQLLDAVAIGQVTPGPVFSTATFIGYVLGGVPGALVATVGIFLPSFVFVAASGPLVPRLRRSAIAGAFLDGVIVGSLALMATVTFTLGRAAIVDVTTALLAAASAFLLLRFRVNSAWLVLGGALVGLAAAALPG
ncbi:MAG TPA: chromate efflux transporter [Candidatus Kryptonia bacterium]|nr:chromate efflux transporter [Candidatus Kryptonia bacterium]